MTSNMIVVFFDGYCGLCSGVVDFLIARDKKRSLLYSPLQGETALKYLSDQERNDLDTVIVLKLGDGGSLDSNSSVKLKKSEAVLAALKSLEGPWKLAAIAGNVFPKPLRDFIYDLVAKNRFKFFGRRDSCRVPSSEERALFLP